MSASKWRPQCYHVGTTAKGKEELAARTLSGARLRCTRAHSPIHSSLQKLPKFVYNTKLASTAYTAQAGRLCLPLRLHTELSVLLNKRAKLPVILAAALSKCTETYHACLEEFLRIVFWENLNHGPYVLF